MTNVYLLCATTGLAFVVLSVLFGWVSGHGHHSVDGHVDAGADGDLSTGDAGHADAAGDHDAGGLPLFSPTALAVLLTTFGGSGLVYGYLTGDRPIIHVPAAGATAALAWVGAAYVALKLARLLETPHVNRMLEALQHEAEVTVSIPEGGFGEVAVIVDGVRQTFPARAEADTTFHSGDRVRIARIVQGSAFVRPAPAFTQASPGALPGPGDPRRKS